MGLPWCSPDDWWKFVALVVLLVTGAIWWIWRVK